MIIDFNKNNVFVLSINMDADVDNDPTIHDLICLKKFDERPKTAFWDNDIKQITKAIYIGNHNELEKEIDSKKTSNLNFKNVFIEKTCNIPTVDLQLNNITRKRSIDTAEACVVKIPELRNTYNKYYVLYSFFDDSYIIIEPFYFRSWVHPGLSKCINSIFDSYAIDSILTKLINSGIIPDHYVVAHFGSINIINDDIKYSFFKNIDKYFNVIYEDEFTQYLSNSKEVLTLETLSEIETLLNSKDVNNVNLGLQILYSYDPRPYAYSIIKMIKNISTYKLRSTKFYSTTKFKSFLQRIDYSIDDLNRSMDHAKNILFEFCCDYDKEIILSEIFTQANRSICHIIATILSYDFLKDINIEKMKIYYNGKDYINSREQE